MTTRTSRQTTAQTAPAGGTTTPPATASLGSLPRLIRESRPLVTVIGDTILDRWWRGSVHRMSREAPVPVVDTAEIVECPGGAANTAMNLAALGGRVRIVTVVGDDEAGERVLSLLDEAGVDTALAVVCPGMTTARKTRVVGGDQVIVRIDETDPEPYGGDSRERFEEAVIAASPWPDAEIVCDYGSGLLDDRRRDLLAGRPRRTTLTVVDAHDPARWAPMRPDIVTPNSDEAGQLIGRPVPSGRARAGFVIEHAREVLSASRAGAAIVTLDRDGAVLIEPDGGIHRTLAHPAAEQQASGAGDTFTAALTLARVCGASLHASARLAQAAADIVVQRPGTSVCPCDELERALEAPVAPVLGAAELAERLAQERQRGHRIVFTNGCFDILHRGHTGYLHQARRLGDVLVVALNDDESVRRLKGEGRPVNPVADRTAVLAAFGCVDYITTFSADTPIRLLRTLKPDVYVKGGDYTREMLQETPIVEGYGGEVCILDYVPSQSTTEVVTRIRTGSSRAATIASPGASSRRSPRR